VTDEPASARGGAPAAPPVAAFDPGRNVGFALVSGEGRLLRNAVLRLEQVADLPLPADARVLVGGGTGRRDVRRALEARGRRVIEVDERDTTLRARELWRRTVAPRGLGRFLPPALRIPPGPIDDFAAWAIALRYLESGEPTETARPGRGAPSRRG
jgi:hypothetical protein